MDRCGRRYVLNAVSANVCVEIGPPLGPKTGCLRTQQWTYLTGVKVCLSPGRKTPDFRA